MTYKQLEGFLNTGELPAKLRCAKEPLEWFTFSETNSRYALNEFYPGLDFEMVRAMRLIDCNAMIMGCVRNGQGEYKNLFVKELWEGMLKETLATELNNLITGREVSYVLYGNLMVTRRIPGASLFESRINIKTEEYAYQYGMLDEFSRPIGLDDRKESNIIVHENGSLWNADFGQAFLHDSSKTLEQMEGSLKALPKRKKFRIAKKKGAEDAREIIKDNIERNIVKLKGIMKSIDEEVCNILKSEGHVIDHKQVHNPKDILLKYVADNGWEDIAKQLQ